MYIYSVYIYSVYIYTLYPLFNKVDTFHCYFYCGWLFVTPLSLNASSIIATIQSLILALTQSFTTLSLSDLGFNVTHYKGAEGFPELVNISRFDLFSWN